ncbi:DUF1611 domain-containing protein [Actinokineospora sp. PR83]|uniref:DUF1611 domain-containing protein n=1 Tax=Actinokineospora sp. PR83 TaxID=2884908 RepID=UPI001F3F5C84|nr:DUF1611 domain-containing protein [Actinokineospora sp. PR83]MCG8914859.1 DUF1611 domain-containing protein [Actinokineospora sp. PR83]
MSAALDPVRVDRLKKAYAVRLLDADALTPLRPAEHRPTHGDVVLAEVTSVGYHEVLELADGRKARLFVGDRVLVAYAARYAPDHFEAELPDDLGPCDLVAAGGVLGKVRSGNAAVSAPPTTVRPLSLLAGPSGRPLNVADFALPAPPPTGRRVPTFVVVGTSMNSGKTTTVASLVHGLTRAGLRVGAAKVTGTAAGGDPWLFRDAGAALALDFTDMGMATTFRVPLERIVAGTEALHGHLTAAGVDAAVLEIADGVLQPETAQLLDHPVTRALADGVLYAAADSTGAIFGVHRLQGDGHQVLAVSGLLTQSPLGVRETQAHVDVPVYGPSDLRSPTIAGELLRRVTTPIPV